MRGFSGGRSLKAPRVCVPPQALWDRAGTQLLRVCCTFSSACAKIEVLASPLQATPPPGQDRTQTPCYQAISPLCLCWYGQEGGFGLCHALGAALWVVLPCTLSVQSPAGDKLLPGAQGSPPCASWPCSSMFMWAHGGCRWLWDEQGAGQPGCVGPGRAAGPRPCKGAQGLMWEGDSGSDLLSFAREMAPVMAWCHSMAERAAGRCQPWRWP